MVWLMALHIATLTIWCAGLFYMPGLFLMHADAHEPRNFHRLRIMTRYSFIMVVSPAAVIAIASGTALVYVRGAQGDWLAAKLVAVALMVFFHLYLGSRLRALRRKNERQRHQRAWHLALTVVPTLLVPLVLWLVLAKPQWLPANWVPPA